MREEKKKSNFFSVFGKILFKVEKEQKWEDQIVLKC